MIQTTRRLGLIVPRRMVSANMTDLFNLTDESLLAFYESVRRQVMADNRLGGRYRLAGAAMKQYADRLKTEMDRRHMQFKPIDWPSS